MRGPELVVVAAMVCGFAFPRDARAQEWLILQGIAQGEAWATDSGSRLLTRNNGEPGVLGQLRLFAGVAPSRMVQLIALGEVSGGNAYTGSEHFELEALILRLSPSRALVLNAGKILTPVGAFAPRRLAPVNPLIGEPDAYPSAYPWGAEVGGVVSRFDYRVAVVSLPPVKVGYVPTPSGRPRMVVGGGVTLFTGARIGGTYTSGSYLGDSVAPFLPPGSRWQDFNHRAVAFDARFSRGYADFHGEYAYAWYEAPTMAAKMKGPAYYLELKYTFVPRFFAAVRFQRNDYPFIRPLAPGRWLTVPANFYAGELGVGFRLGPGLLAKVSYQKDDWKLGQLSGQAIAAQVSWQFDVADWIAGRVR